jgi:hypothetical protein
MLLETTSTSTLFVASKYTTTEKDVDRLNDPNNITASFSKNLYTVSSLAKKNGQMTTKEQQSIVTSLLAKEGEKIETKVYTMDDLKIIEDESPVAKKTYGNTMGTLFKKAVALKLDTVDLNTIKAYSTSKDASLLASLVIKKNNAKMMTEELLRVQTPRSAAPYHLLIINRLSEYTTVLDNLTKAETDPMRATLAFNNYLPSIKSLFTSLTFLQEYFTLQEITFSKNEPGYVLTVGYTTQQ